MKTGRTLRRLFCVLLCCAICLSMAIIASAAGYVTEVSNYDDLYDAVHRKDRNIRLTDDIRYDCPSEKAGGGIMLSFSTGETVLDLNNHSILFFSPADHPYNSKMFNFLSVSGTAKLTIKNGTIQQINYRATDKDSRGPVSVADDATLITYDVNIKNEKPGSAIYAKDNACVILNGGVVSSFDGYAIATYGGPKLYLNKGVELKLASNYLGTPEQGKFPGHGSLSMTGCTDTAGLVISKAKFTSGITVQSESLRAASFDISTHNIKFGSSSVLKPIYDGTDLNWLPNKDDYYSDASWHSGNLIRNSGDYVYVGDVVVTAANPKLSGSVTIKGTTKTAGDTVTVDTSGITSTLAPFSLHYQWQIQQDDKTWQDIADATAESYVTQKADGGKMIRIVVTADGYEGELAGGRYINPKLEKSNVTVINGVAKNPTGSIITEFTENGYVTLIANPAPQWKEFDKWVVTGVTVEDENSETTHFTMPASEVIAEATYKDHPHSYTSSEVTAPTCSEQGYTTHTCVCGDSITDTYVDAAGHSGGTATCIKRAECAVCGAEYGDLKAHDYSAAWASNKDSHWHVCTVCPAKTDSDAHTDADKDNKCDTCGYVGVHSHAGEAAALKAATDEEDGVKAHYECTCGKWFEDESCTKELTENDCRIPAAKSVQLAAVSYTYDGTVKAPAVTVVDADGNTLVEGEDYTVTYPSGRKNVGKYTVTITGKGSYNFTKTVSFTIKPVRTSISKLSAGKKSLTVKWRKKTTQTTGYQIQYSTKSDFSSGRKTSTVSSNKTVSKTFKNLKSGKTYYVRIRTYKTVGKTRFYSDWSAVKKVKVK